MQHFKWTFQYSDIRFPAKFENKSRENDCTYSMRAQPFRYWWRHQVYFYELRPPVSSKHFNFLHCICSAATH